VGARDRVRGEMKQMGRVVAKKTEAEDS